MLATVIISAILVGVVILNVRRLLRSRGNCSCGCENCPGHCGKTAGQ